MQLQAPLIIGVGSHHGDDQAGWLVIDSLSDNCRDAVELRKVAVPHQLLDWSSTDRLVHVIDAVLGTPGTWNRLTIEPSKITEQCVAPKVMSSSSHQFGLVDTIRLGATMGRLPANLCLWTIGMEQAQPCNKPSHPVQTAVKAVAEQIRQSLRH